MTHYKLDVTIDGLPKRVNQLSGRQWYAKNNEKNLWLEKLHYLTQYNRPQNPIRRARLTCIRYSSTCPDYDGLVSSFKHVIDSLVTLDILEDDSMDHIGMPEFMWAKTTRGKGKIQIVLEEIFI